MSSPNAVVTASKPSRHRGHGTASFLLFVGGGLFLGLMWLHLRSESWRVTLNDAVVIALLFVGLAICQLLIASIGEVDAERRFRWDSKIGSLGGARSGYVFSSPLVLLASFLLVVLATCVVAIYEQHKLPPLTKESSAKNVPAPPGSKLVDR